MNGRSGVFREIDREISRNTRGLERLTTLKREENRRIQEYKDYEHHKWLRFRHIIDGEEFFEFEHLRQIGVDFKIGVHLSAKNAGKTTAIYREMARLIRKGEKFLYGRVYPGEMDSVRWQFEVDELCPVVMLKRDNRYYFYAKEDIEAWRLMRIKTDGIEDENTIHGYPRIVDLDRVGIKPVGLGYTFYNSNSLGGMNYEGYTTIFFDEILSYSAKNMINKKVLDAWDASLSTIARRKPDLKVYMMGNLQDVTTHPILDFYGINVDDNLRIIRRGPKGECVILYVNSGGLYGSSFRNQAAITKHGGIEHQAFLMDNKQVKPTPNVLTERIFGEMDHDVSLAFNMTPDPFYVDLRKLYDPETSKLVYCLKCSVLRMTTMTKGTIYTDDPNVFNRFHNVRRRLTVEQPFNHINRLYMGGNLKFDSMDSVMNFALVYTKHKQLVYEYGK